MSNLLDFESDLVPLERELENVRGQGNGKTSAPSTAEQELAADIERRLREIYGELSPWQTVQVARHRDRPYTLDYLQWAFSDFLELRGDRHFAEDRAIVGGPALLDGRSMMIIGHQKGRDTRENVERNFGMPHPEGYRKAERLMRQAERLGLPVVTFIDTPGANAGLEDEERGQAEAIASSIATMLSLRVPTICLVVGEGGSGGALAIAAADRVLMLEHAIFTVASPEAAAAILCHDSGKAPEAAAALKLTARDLKGLGLVDEIVAEPVGGAHRDHAGAAHLVSQALERTLAQLLSSPINRLLEERYQKYRGLNFYRE